jgi:hypothetical protein
MAKRKVRNQIGSLTPDHKMSKIDLTSMHAGGMWHIVGKLSTRATTLFQSRPDQKHKVIAPQHRKNFNLDSFGTPLWESRDKKPFGYSPRGEVQSILYGGRWWLPSSPGHGESCESEIARGLS